GDGKTDLACGYDYGGSNAALFTFVSTGSSFSAQQWWLSGAGNFAWSACGGRFTTGDFNGDGKTDLACGYDYGNSNAALFTFLSLGSSFSVQQWWLSGAGNFAWSACGGRFTTGDFNGDGKTDLACGYDYGGSNAAVFVFLSLGTSFTVQQWWLSGAGNFAWSACGDRFTAGDFNGDGRTDLVCGYDYGSSNAAVFVFLSLGSSVSVQQWWLSGVGNFAWSACGGRFAAADFNGDGKTDLACGYDYGSSNAAMFTWVASSGAPDLLGTVANGLGGTTTATYRPSSAWSNGYLPAGMVFQTASSVTISDGRGDLQSTNYTYQGARWRDATAADPTREFLGFRKATTTIGATGAYSETYYWQRAGTVAKPQTVYKRKADGTVMSFDQFTFTENAAAPYTSLATQAWSYECNGHGTFDANGNYTGGCRRVVATYAWDQYANLTTEYLYGDYDLGGDERTAVRSFAVNSAAYIVGQPAYEELRAGIGTGGALLTRTRFFYDGAAAEGTPPVACPAAGNICGGLLTKKGVWNDQTGLYVEHTFGYDAFGNETSVTDPLGQTSAKGFDPTCHVLTTSTTNPLGHVVQSGWDELGRLTSTTDPDSNVTTHSYDVFGRGLLTTRPDGAQVKVEHLAYGDLANQRIRTSTLLAGGQWVWDDSYFDGLGRPYRTVSSTGVTADTIYGPTGKVWKQSLPYLAGDPVRYDVHGYDDL
ncbi:MAG TPA: FG-GAP-like repeat-containing protein, partial [Polyangia bacterium]